MSASTARKFEFKVVDIMEEREGRDVKVGTFDYAVQYRSIVTSPIPNQGISADDTIKAIEALTPIKEGKAKKQGFALLDKDSYDFLISRLSTHRFGVAHEVVSDFIKYLRDLPVVEMAPAESTKAPAGL